MASHSGKASAVLWQGCEKSKVPIFCEYVETEEFCAALGELHLSALAPAMSGNLVLANGSESDIVDNWKMYSRSYGLFQIEFVELFTNY